MQHGRNRHKHKESDNAAETLPFPYRILINMPEPLTQSEVDSKTDPTVAKQFDTETPKSEQIDDFYKTVDKLQIGLLTTMRPGIGPVSRSMAVAKRNGPDFLFFANNHSKKFSDLENDKTAQITFQNSYVHFQHQKFRGPSRLSTAKVYLKPSVERSLTPETPSRGSGN